MTFIICKIDIYQKQKAVPEIWKRLCIQAIDNSNKNIPNSKSLFAIHRKLQSL
jgi:hypothetical protein